MQESKEEAGVPGLTTEAEDQVGLGVLALGNPSFCCLALSGHLLVCPLPTLSRGIPNLGWENLCLAGLAQFMVGEGT